MGLQRTISKSITLKGIGVHFGKPVTMTLHPAAPNEGIYFVRTDLESGIPIAAHYSNIVDTRLATTLGNNSVQISTVEHLMAALFGLQIDNLRVEVDSPEIPILDGSAKGFLDAIESVGIEQQVAPKVYLKILKKIELKAGEKWAIALPSEDFKITSTIEWDHPAIGYQEFTYQEGFTSFKEVASARTFGFLKDVEALRSKGLCRGGTLENAIVLDNAKVLNPEGLRYPNEFVRHKVLDAMGDFKLSGFSLLGHFRLHRSGHDLHQMLLNQILKDKSQYEIISAATESKSTLQHGSHLKGLGEAISRASQIAASF